MKKQGRSFEYRNLSKPKQLHKFKRTPWGPSRHLVIQPLYLECRSAWAKTRFTSDDIEAIRFGSTSFWLYFFPVVITYSVEVQSSQGKTMSIRMHSFFGIGNKKILKQYARIYGQIQKTYFNDMAIHYVKLLLSGFTYELAGTYLTKEGILLTNGKPLIPWPRVAIAEHSNACSIYDLSDTDHVRFFDYWYDWNASLLHSVVDFKILNDSFDLADIQGNP